MCRSRTSDLCRHNNRRTYARSRRSRLKRRRAPAGRERFRRAGKWLNSKPSVGHLSHLLGEEFGTGEKKYPAISENLTSIATSAPASIAQWPARQRRLDRACPGKLDEFTTFHAFAFLHYVAICAWRGCSLLNGVSLRSQMIRVRLRARTGNKRTALCAKRRHVG